MENGEEEESENSDEDEDENGYENGYENEEENEYVDENSEDDENNCDQNILEEISQEEIGLNSQKIPSESNIFVPNSIPIPVEDAENTHGDDSDMEMDTGPLEQFHHIEDNSSHQNDVMIDQNDLKTIFDMVPQERPEPSDSHEITGGISEADLAELAQIAVHKGLQDNASVPHDDLSEGKLFAQNKTFLLSTQN